MNELEKVRVFAEWCDGARAGIADYEGRPHLFISDFVDVDDKHREEASLLLSITAEETQALLADLAAAGSAWSHCGRRTYRDSEGTLYPPWDHADRDEGLRQAEQFQRIWSEFKAKVTSRASDCVVARGDFQASRVAPAEAVEKDSDDRLPLEVSWQILAVQAGRDEIAAALRRWQQMSSVADRTQQDANMGDELSF